MLGQRTNGSYEQDSVRSGEEVSCKTLTQTNQKSKKTDKCIVSGYRPKAGVVDQGTTNLVCRRHEFGMGHLRDPAACYLDSTLSEYRRLRPRQKRFLFFFLRFSSQDFPVKRDVEKQIFQTRCRTTSPTLTTVNAFAHFCRPGTKARKHKGESFPASFSFVLYSGPNTHTRAPPGRRHLSL